MEEQQLISDLNLSNMIRTTAVTGIPQSVEMKEQSEYILSKDIQYFTSESLIGFMFIHSV